MEIRKFDPSKVDSLNLNERKILKYVHCEMWTTYFYKNTWNLSRCLVITKYYKPFSRNIFQVRGNFSFSRVSLRNTDFASAQEISLFCYHSDFTWNQFGHFRSAKYAIKTHWQCGNFMIILALRFNVKSIMEF